jgi:RNA polymerase sigma-70 factor, ECF subfamily
VHLPSPDEPITALDDLELATRVMAAAPEVDGAAEAELCRRFAPRIRLYGLKHLRDSAAAADLVQDVLMLTLQRLRKASVRDPDRLASFVFGVCRQRVIDQGRGTRRREHLLEVYAGDLPVSTPAEEPPLDTDRLRLCLEQLPQRDRTVILMSFYDQRPAAEVAGELNLSEQNVRVIRHRCLRRLRTCMDGSSRVEEAQ